MSKVHFSTIFIIIYNFSRVDKGKAQYLYGLQVTEVGIQTRVIVMDTPTVFLRYQYHQRLKVDLSHGI